MLLAGPVISESMTFRWITPCEGIGRLCTHRILAKGDIDSETGVKLQQFLTTAQSSETGPVPSRGIELCLDSQGGDLQGALQLGGLIRDLHMDTCVQPNYPPSSVTAGTALMQRPALPTGMCASACVFAFAAGQHRTVHSGARIGMHQFAGEGKDLGQARTQMTIAQLGQYLEQYGVQRKLLDIGAFVPHSLARFLTAQEIVETNLDNTTQRYEAWRLSALQDGQVYAHVRQRNPATDSCTELLMYKNGQRVRLDISFSVAPDERNATRPASGGRDAQSIRGILSGANVWLRLDDQDFGDFGPAQWQYTDNVSVRSLDIELNKLPALTKSHLLEV